MEIFRLFGTISINKAKAIADMNAVSARGSTLGTKLGNVFKTLGKVAIAAFALIAAAGAFIFVKAISAAADFELGMAKVKAISGATAEEFAALTAEAERLGLVTAQSMTDIAIGMEEFARAGFEATEIIQAMSGAVALAESQTMGLAEAVRITAAVLNGMRLEASESERVANALAAAASSSATTVESLGEAMKYLAPVAANLRVPLEEALAVVGKLGDAGLRGGIATRAFSTALLGLASPTEEAAGMMEQLGIEFFNTQGEFIGITGVIGVLEEALEGMTVEQQQVALGAMFTGAAVKSFSILLGVGSEELSTYQDELTGTAAAFDQQAAMLDTLKGQWTILKGSVSALFVALGTSLMPVLKDLLEKRIIPAVNSTILWVKEMGGLLGVIDMVKTKIREWADEHPLLISAVQETWDVIKGLGSFLVNVFQGDWSDAWDDVKSVVQSAGTFIKDAVTTAWNALPIDPAVKAKIENVLTSIKDWAVDAFGVIKQYAIDQFDAIKDFLGAAFHGDWESAWTALKDIAVNAFTAIKDQALLVWEHLPIPDETKAKVENTLTSIRDVAVAAFGWIKEKAVEAWDGITASVEEHAPIIITAWGSVATAAQSLWATIKEYFSLMIGSQNDLSGAVYTFGDAVEFVFSGVLVIVEVALKLIAIAFDAVETVIGAVTSAFGFLDSLLRGDVLLAWEYFKDFIGGIIDGILNIIDTLFPGFKASVERGWESVITVFQNAGHALLDLLESWMSSLWDIGARMAHTIRDGVASAWDTVITWFQNAWNGLIADLTSWMPDFLKQWLGIGEDSGQAYADGLESQKSTAEDAATVVGEAAVEAIAQTAEEMEATGKDLGEAFAGALTETSPDAGDAGLAVSEAVTDALETSIDIAGGLGEDAGESFKDGLFSLEPDVFDTGITLGGAAEDGIRDRLGMFSPSTVMFDAGVDAGTGFKEGMEDTIPDIIEVVEDLGDEIEDESRSFFERLVDLTRDSWDDMRDETFDAAQDIVDTISESWEDAKDATSSALGDMFNAVVDHYQDEEDATEDHTESIWDILKEGVRNFLVSLRETLLLKAAWHLVEGIALAFIPGMQVSAAGHLIAAGIYAAGGAGLAIAGFEEGAVFDQPTMLPAHMVAEGGVSEAYLPLSTKVFGNIGQGIVDALSGSTMTPALVAGAGGLGNTIRVDMRGLYDGATINVRNDQDITRIAEETHSLWRSRMRGEGINV